MPTDHLVLRRSLQPRQLQLVKPTSKVLLLPSAKREPILNPRHRHRTPILAVNFNLVLDVNICSILSIHAVSYSCFTDNKRIMKGSRVVSVQ